MKFVSMAFALLLIVVMTGCAVAQPGLSVAAPLRIDEVVAMSQRGESDSTIIAQIQQRGAAFVLTPEDLEQQRAAGVSGGLLRYLQGRVDGDQALRARILSGSYPYPTYYGSYYLGYSYLGYHGGQHYYGGAPHGNSGGRGHLGGGGHLGGHGGGGHGGGGH